MSLAVNSSSAALKVLQAEASHHAKSGQQDRDPLRSFLDPRSLLALPIQSLDALLALRAQLRQGQEHESQAQQPQRGLLSVSGASTPGHSGMLAAWANAPKVHMQSRLDQMIEQWASLKTRSTEPVDSALMPWNSPDVIQQLKDMDKYGDDSDAPYRAFIGNDAAIYKGMSETPAEDRAMIKLKGGDIWYETSQFREKSSEKDFFRNIKNYILYGINLTSPIDPSNELSKAVMNDTAQMIRGSSIPEFYDRSAEYTMYAYNSSAGQYKWVGGWSRNDNNISKIVDDLKKRNPTMNVTWMAEDDDVAFILYPKANSIALDTMATAQSSATGTGTNQTAVTLR